MSAKEDFELQKQMEKKTDQELLDIVSDTQGWFPKTRDAARAELQSRSVALPQESVRTSSGKPALSTAAGSVEYLDVTLERVLVIWWSLVWRTLVFGIVVGAVLGFCGGFLVGFAGHPELGTAVGLILGWLGSIPLSIVLLRIVLMKKYPEFSIRIIRNR